MYFFISFMLGCWMFQDFKRISFTSRLRYLYLVLCMFVQPLIFGYLFMTWKARKAVDKHPFLNAWTVPMLVLCIVLWNYMGKTYALAPILKNPNPYEPIAVNKQKVLEAKEFLCSLGLSDYYYDAAAFQDATAVFLQECLKDAELLEGRGELGIFHGSNGGEWLVSEEFPDYRVSSWIFRNACHDAAVTVRNEHYVIVTCIDWAEDTVLQEAELYTLFPEDCVQDYNPELDRKSEFYFWLEDGSKYYGNTISYEVGSLPESICFYGKSPWKKYTYHACCVNYIAAQKKPEYVTLALSQKKGGLFGKEQSVLARKYEFHTLTGYPWEIGRMNRHYVTPEILVSFSEGEPSATGGEMLITNETTSYIELYGFYKIQMEVNGFWYDIEVGKGERAFAPDKLSSGRSFSKTIDWSGKYYELPAGKYRILLAVSIHSGNERESSLETYCGCEFEMKE